MAQNTERYNECVFTKLSPNGQYTAGNVDGVITIYDRGTKQSNTFADPEGWGYFYLGLGACMNDLGVTVGSDTQGACYWVKDQQTMLPQESGLGTTMNGANAISADGKYIVGDIAPDGASFGGEGTMSIPVLWTRNEDGTYTMEVLPYPALDWTGRAPQYVMANEISADGSVIIGQVRDNAGFVNYPLIYKKDDEGKWDYKFVDNSLLYKQDLANELAMMEYIDEYPDQPEHASYMTEEEVEAYNKAVEDYNEQMDLYHQGLIDEYPEWVEITDYIVANKEKWQADSTAYQNECDRIYANNNEFLDKYAEACTGSTFTFNSIVLSRNGKYLGLSLETTVGDDPWTSQTTYLPYLYNIEGEKAELMPIEGENLLINAVSSNGYVTCMDNSQMSMNHQGYVVKPGETKAVRFDEFVAEKAPNAAKFIVDNFSFDVTSYEFDEEGNPFEVVVEDSLITGAVFCNDDASVFVSYIVNEYTFEETDPMYTSYVVDLNKEDETAISNVVSDEKAVLSREYYDLQGKRISAPVNAGVYLEKVITGKGVKTLKRIR